jgi:uncharacterized NAD-dependent epimerase/dehydratase family protein
MRKLNIALLDSGIELSHKAFTGWTIPQFVNQETGWEEKAYEPQHGHGTAVASILINNAADFSLASYVLFEQKLSVPVERCISALENILNSREHYDIVHMSLGVRYYSKRLEELCIALREKGTVIISAFDNIGSVSYPAAFPSVIGTDASFRCFKKDEFVYVSDDGIINLKAKGGNQRIAWLNNSFVITQGSSYAAAYVTAQCIKLLQDNTPPQDILAWFKNNAIYVYPEPQIAAEPVGGNFFPIEKAVVFPCNKEVTSILRFSDLLDFELLGVFDIKNSGNIGRTITGFTNDTCYTVKNIDDCPWGQFDTLILGHTYDLEFFSKAEVRGKLLELCLKNKTNVFSFDDEMVDEELVKTFRNNGIHLYYPSLTPDDMSLKMGKMFTSKTPVLGVVGTSSQQGKFTLQLQLRKRFLRDDYAIGQLGSEPESLLFGMDAVYPFGFRSTLSMDYLKSIEYLNFCISRMDKKQPDLIMVGSQAGTWPMMFNHITNFPLDRLCFLLGTLPDAVILCINYHDKPDDIKRSVTGIEALSKCKVIACSLFPLGYKDDWDLVRGAKSTIPDDELERFCKNITELLSIPCYVFDEEAGPEALYRESVNFFKKK